MKLGQFWDQKRIANSICSPFTLISTVSTVNLNLLELKDIELVMSQANVGRKEAA